MNIDHRREQYLAEAKKAGDLAACAPQVSQLSVIRNSSQPDNDPRIPGQIPVDNVASFPVLDTYVGHRVAVRTASGKTVDRGVVPIAVPGQLQLLSTALAAPEKTWYFFTRIQRGKM